MLKQDIEKHKIQFTNQKDLNESLEMTVKDERAKYSDLQMQLQ